MPAAVAAPAEPRKPAARGAAKRPPARKGGAQLVINRPQTETEAAPESPAPTDVTRLAPETRAAEATAEPAAAAASKPSVVPVLTPPAPLAGRKTRFGLPRRLQTSSATPATLVEAPVISAESTPTDVPAASAEPAVVETPAAEAPVEAPAAPEEAPRRYRFDRSRRAAGAPLARPNRVSAPATSPYTPSLAVVEPPIELPSIEELTERVRAAEPYAEPAVIETPASALEAAAPVTEPVTESEIPESEEAPELGEAGEEDASATGGRRRRRRRRGSTLRNGAHPEESELEPSELPSAPLEESEAEVAPDAETASSYGMPDQGYPYEPESRRSTARPRPDRYGYGARTAPAPVEPGWGEPQPRVPAYQEAAPYAGPEPSFARGFGPTPRGVATTVRETYPTRPARVERSAEAAPTSSIAQLGAVIRESINAQTDRLLNELRRQQTPPALTLSLPAMPTNERVGVFVDVANLIYSARSLRVNIDFGHLLDFLRGNRRLARAQAYAPTNPEPGADQIFLSAVKGLGYRITTKNYKTFSSGAKKADLDLDLCMDIVRLVDAKALDTVVLVSGDSDFLPLLDYCADHGVRVEVAAFDDAASMILRQSCDLFINLSLVEAIRG
jgi:uncharacterized LabA/DUF88 family protein